MCFYLFNLVLLRNDLIDLDPSLSFLQYNIHDAHFAVQLSDDEFFLAFDGM